MPPSFTFVDVVRERVSPEATMKTLRRHLWYGGRPTGGIIRPSNGTCTAVSGNSEHGG